MVLPDPHWEPVEADQPTVKVNKDTGRLLWNAPANQYLGMPKSVSLEFDCELCWIGLKAGNDYAVVLDEDGNYYIDAQSALESCGLEFPLDDHIVVHPDAPQNSHNRVVIELE